MVRAFDSIGLTPLAVLLSFFLILIILEFNVKTLIFFWLIFRHEFTRAVATVRNRSCVAESGLLEESHKNRAVSS